MITIRCMPQHTTEDRIEVLVQLTKSRKLSMSGHDHFIAD